MSEGRTGWLVDRPAKTSNRSTIDAQDRGVIPEAEQSPNGHVLRALDSPRTGDPGAPATLAPPALSPVLEAPTPSKKGGKYPEGGPLDPRDHPASCPGEIVDAAQGLIRIPRSKVALVGFASGTIRQAPANDPEWCIMGLNQNYRYLPRVDVEWEIHLREIFLADQVRDTNYLQWLQTCGIPVMAVEVFPDIPTSVRYPLEAINEWISGGDGQGVNYLTSTPAEMLAWVLWSRAIGLNAHITTVGIWGIDLIVGIEYDFQKPCMEFWLGLAKGLGVRLLIPDKSALLKTLGVYGRHVGGPGFGPFTREKFEQRINQIIARKNELITELNRCDGALHDNEAWLNMLTVSERHGYVPSPEELAAAGQST